MRRYCLLLTCLTVILAAITGATLGSQQPNVVLVITDDQGYGDLGCHGNPILKTPNLDRLYTASVRFTDFHTDPTCSPTRAALMTGRYSTRVGVWHTVMGRHMPRRNEVMMPAAFAAAGYKTAIFGKWHLGDGFPFRPQDRGFDEVLIHGGGGVGQIPDYWGNDYFDDTYFRNGKPEKFEGYCTDVFFREAIKFIESNRERPFFVYLTTNAPHGPYRVPQRFSAPYADQVGEDAELAKFYGMIANIDDNVGRLRDALQRLDLAENTVFIFMTDNGTARGATFTDYRGNKGQMLSGYNVNMRGRKGSPYEGGHRVPCFISWPASKWQTGRDVPQLATHMDLFPTLIDVCGLESPRGVEFDGTSLAPLLAGNQSWRERTMFVHHQELPDPEKYRFACVMREQWRLIMRNDLEQAPKFELYDVDKDPGQKHDIRSLHEPVVAKLRAAYDRWWDDIATGFDDDAAAVLGSDQANPTRLTCFEWHGSRRWWQRNVRAGFQDNGSWAVEVAKPGTYRITLRRWPAEANLAITAPQGSNQEVKATEARIRIAGTELQQPIPDGATSISFETQLPQTKTTLETWILDRSGESRGAYYATVKRLP
jgi:arylsulfatase A-like enzyme